MSGELTPWMTDKLSALLRFAERQGILAHVVSTRRSCAEQNAIYEGAPGVATQVSGCKSWHVWGRAADLAINGPAEDYAVLGAEWKRMGGIWGGDFSFGDYGHFEWHPDVKMSELCADDGDCPEPNAPWPEDRPMLARPAVRGILGVGVAAVGVVLARRMLKR